MSTTISFTVEKPFLRKINKLISETGLYQSKSEFLRDAAREKMVKMLELEQYLKAVESARKNLQSKAKFKGQLSPEERDRIAREYLKKR